MSSMNMLVGSPALSPWTRNDSPTVVPANWVMSTFTWVHVWELEQTCIGVARIVVPAALWIWKSCEPKELDSFPTRRSSDLSVEVPAGTATFWVRTLSPGVSPPVGLPRKAENVPEWAGPLLIVGVGLALVTVHGARLPVSNPVLVSSWFGVPPLLTVPAKVTA